VSEYHLQARRAVAGSCPRTEETRLTDAGTLDDALSDASELADEGFTVWVFRRTQRARLTAAPGPLHLVTTIRPTSAGAADRTAGRRVSGDDTIMLRRR
jgi:hypothetical protein